MSAERSIRTPCTGCRVPIVIFDDPREARTCAACDDRSKRFLRELAAEIVQSDFRLARTLARLAGVET